MVQTDATKEELFIGYEKCLATECSQDGYSQ